MKHVAACLLFFVTSLALPVALCAQDDSARLDDDAFWLLVAATRAELRTALAQPPPASIDPALMARWEQLHTVRSGGADVTVDTTWVVAALSSADPQSLAALQDRIAALLSDYVRRVAAGESGLSADSLNSVLQDPRFKYAEFTPTPIPERPPRPDLRPVTNAVGLELSQVLLTVAGVVFAIGFVIFFARRLSINPTELPSGAAPSAEPVTSSEAVDVSAGFAAQRDYRSAIRYLYLSSLLTLDERGLIRYDSALTNREHLRQVRERPQLHDLLRAVVNVFEDVWYGYQAVDEASYLEFRQQISDLRRLVL